MSARNIYRVKPSGKKWIVLKEEDVLSVHALKNQALDKASALAEKKISSQVLVYRTDGSIHFSNH